MAQNNAMETGDLLFTLIGRADNAISSVTAGYRGARVNHMGVVVINRRGTFVLEAFPPEVRLTNIAVFLRRTRNSDSRERYMVGRLDSEHRHHIPDRNRMAPKGARRSRLPRPPRRR